MRFGLRVALWSTAGAAGAAVLVAVLAYSVIGVPAWILLALGTTFDSPPATPPVQSLSVTREHGRTTEIHATLTPGYRLSEVADLRLFDGFTGPETLEKVEQRLGPPSGWAFAHAQAAGIEKSFRWVVDAQAPFYDRPLGRVMLRPYRTPEQGIFTMPVGYPKDCSLSSFFKDVRLRAQITTLLPETGVAALNIHLSDGWGGFEVSLGRLGCTDVTLGNRD